MKNSNGLMHSGFKLSLLLMMLFSTSVFAQKIHVNGRITDTNKEGIIGASVLEKGTTNGVISDIDGNFVLEVDSKSTLVISYIIAVR